MRAKHTLFEVFFSNLLTTVHIQIHSRYGLLRHLYFLPTAGWLLSGEGGLHVLGRVLQKCFRVKAFWVYFFIFKVISELRCLQLLERLRSQ